MNQREVMNILEDIPLRTELTSAEAAEVALALSHPGFKHIIGLMLGARQAQYVMLTNVGLGTAERSCQASVIQGKIQGLDSLRETIVSVFPPAADGSAPEANSPRQGEIK